MSGKIIVIDLEATCWEGNPPPGEISEIIEIGICVLDQATGVIDKNRGILIKPVHSAISPFCTQLTTITPDLIGKEGISFEEALHILGKEYQAGQHAWPATACTTKTCCKKQCALRHIPYPMHHEHINREGDCSGK